MSVMNPHAQDANFDAAQVAVFESAAEAWWDPDGEFRPLHDINPARAAYIERHVDLRGRRAVDVGCGGGLLCEALARDGAEVTGIDVGEGTLSVAAAHAREAELDIRYADIPAETLAADEAGSFAAVACLEVLEHVPDPAALVGACAQLAAPDGRVFFSTLNRTPAAWLLAVVGAEYVMRVIPKGTHEYRRFIKPSELARMALGAGLEVLDISGLHYHPLARRCTVDKRISVNYLMCCRRPE